MLFLKIILILQLINNTFSNVSIPKEIKEPNNILPKKLQNSLKRNSTIDANKKTPGIRLRLPFMDMELQNQRNVHIIQEKLQKQLTFVIHGNELFQMFVSRDEKRLSLIGYLGGSLNDNEPLGAEIIDLREFLIMVVALEERLEVYQLSEQILESRAQITKDPKRSNETAPIFEPIQQISLPGRYRQHFLTDPSQERIMLIVGINFTKLYGRLHTFSWSNSYFEPIEELTISPIHSLYIMGSYPKYLVRGRIIKHQTKTIITVAEIQSNTMNLYKTQTLTVNSHTVHAGSIRGKHYLIACSSKQKQCNSFRMGNDGLFSVYKHRTSADLAFDKFTGGQYFAVATRQNQVMVYTNGRMDCYASFKTNETDVTSILTFGNTHGEHFLLLNYKRPFRMLIRMVELESESGGLLGATAYNATEIEDTSTLYQHRHMFEETIGSLRSLLLRRRLAMSVFRSALNPNLNSTRPVKLNLAHPIRIHGGAIQNVKLIGSNLRSPLQLLQRVAQMRQSSKLRRFRRDLNETTTVSNLKVKRLKLKNLIYEGEVLKGFHLDNLAKPQPILSVRPKLTTNSLWTEKLLTHHKIRHPRHDESLENITSPVMKLKELNVTNINGVPWQEFYNSLFLKNRDTKIKGRLILQAATNITNLRTTLFNGLAVKNLFNLKEYQEVATDILFRGMLILELIAETVNGLDFGNDIVFSNTNSLIESPVNMLYASIVNDISMNDNVTIKRTKNDEEEGFQQHYTGRVIINGTLTVKNLLQENESTKTFVDRKPFTQQHLKQKFLLLQEPQSFNSTIKFGNAKVTVPSLNTNFLNDNPTEEYLLANQQTSIKKPLLLIFMNATIEGDLEIANQRTRIANLSQNIVHPNEITNITGEKLFKAPLIIDELMTLSINQMPVSDLILKSQIKYFDLRFNDIKTFNGLQVKQDLMVNKSLNTMHLNKLPLRNFLNQDYHFKYLEVPHKLEARNIIFHKINDISFDKIFENFNISDGKLLLHKQIIIEGNLKFVENLNLTNINGLNWQDYQADLVRVNENAIIEGRKCFLEELTITNSLKTTKINNLILEQDFEYILSKSRPQLINGTYAFGNIRFSNLDVTFINDVSTTEFIDMRAKNITIESDIYIPKIIVLGNVKSNDINMHYGLKDLTWKISELHKQKWQKIVVLENAYWNNTIDNDKSQHELLSYLYKNAVQRNGKQVISGNVKFIKPLITKVTTKTAFPKNFDLDFLIKDCVFKMTNETQVITAEKTFLMALQLHNVSTNGFLDAHLLNGIDVLRFNASLYRLSSQMPIIGTLKFLMPPMIKKLFIQHNINGINPAMIYNNKTEPVPPLRILSNFIIEKPLQIFEVNNESLESLLKNRLTKYNKEPQDIEGYLNFENLIFNENNVVQKINEVNVDNLVFKKSKQLQAINGAKILENELKLEGPAQVMTLNGHDIIDSYQQTIFKNRNYEHESLRLKSATFEKGIILSKDVEPMIGDSQAVNFTTPATAAAYIKTELQNFNKTLEIKTTKLRPKNLLYLDYAVDWQISCSPPNVSIQKTYTQTLKRTSLCERQFINVYISNPNATKFGQIFLNNSTANFIIASAYNLSIKAENYCQKKYHNIKSKITITGIDFTRVIGMKKYIEKIFIYKPINQSDIYLLFHAIELADNRHEIRILKMPISLKDNITDWQSLTIGIGKNVKIFDFKNFTALISGGDGSVIDNQPTLSIYHFNSSTAKFEMKQKIFGDFDIFELLPIESKSNEFQLILSCSQCRRIHIYNYKADLVNASYEIFQLITLKTLIDKIQVFRLSDGILFMLLLGEQEQQYYYLYKYTQLEGWQHATYGYFENTQMVIPLKNEELDIDDQNLLVLLCGLNECSLVKAVIV